jgi:hypothetical protein
MLCRGQNRWQINFRARVELTPNSALEALAPALAEMQDHDAPHAQEDNMFAVRLHG